jgi:pentatricopeptide repeat protein
MYASKGTANIINTVARQGLLSKQLTAASRPTTLLPSPNRSAGKLYATGRASLSANRQQQQQQQDSTTQQGTNLNPIQAWTGNNSAAIFQKYAGVRYNHSAAASAAQQDGAESSGSSHPDATKRGNARILEAKRSRDLRKVESEFKRMKESGVQLSAQTYTLVLDSYATLRKPGHPPQRLLAVYQEMIEGGYKPSAYTYMILIHALCKRDMEVQKTLLMLNKQTGRSGQTPSNLESLQSENNIQKALAIFEASVTDDLYQDFDTEVFNSLLRSLSQYGNTQDGIYVFEHLEKARSAEPNGRTFAALITLYGKAGDIQGALECFNEYKTVRGSMEKHNPSFVYSALVDAYIKCGDPSSARKIIEEDSVNDNVETSVKTWNTLMREYCDQKNLESAYDVLAKLQNDPALPNPVASTYGPLLTALSELKMTDKAHEIYNKMAETDISKSYNNLATYAHLLLENKDLDRLQNVMFDMSKKGLDPEESLTDQFVMQLADKDINRAIEALRQLYADVSSRSFVKVTDGINQTAMHLAAKPNNSLSNILDILKIVHPFGVRASVPVSEMICKAFTQTHKDPASWSKLKETFGVTEHFLTIEALFNSHNLSHEEFRNLALDMAKAMVEVNIQPNSGLYARVGARLAKSQDEEGEKQWQAFFEPYLKEESPQVDKYKADEQMMHRTTKGDLLTGAAMKAAVQGKKDECLDILKKQIVDQKMVPTIEAVREMIHIFGRDHGVASARNIYEVVSGSFDMLPDKLIRKKAHATALASLLNVHLQAKDFDAGQAYYNQRKLPWRWFAIGAARFFFCKKKN